MWLHASLLKLLSMQCLCAWLCILFVQYAHASPLLNTDDPEITAYAHCQLETSVMASKPSATVSQFNTACQVVKGVETSLGYANTSAIANSTAWSAQIKSVLVPMQRWGLAASLSTTKNDSPVGDQRAWFLNFPSAVSLNDGHIHLYSNIGYQKVQSHDDLMRWSTAMDIGLTQNTGISLEFFNQDRQAPFTQAVIHHVFSDVLSLEFSFGQRLQDFRQRWFGFGLSFTP